MRVKLYIKSTSTDDKNATISNVFSHPIFSLFKYCKIAIGNASRIASNVSDI